MPEWTNRYFVFGSAGIFLPAHNKFIDICSIPEYIIDINIICQ